MCVDASREGGKGGGIVRWHIGTHKSLSQLGIPFWRFHAAKNVARLYGLAKVHKQDTPVRPLLSVPGSVLQCG